MEKYIQWVNCRWQFRSIFIRLAVVASEICEILRNSPKIRTDFGANRKRTCDFLLVVINSNFDHIYHFRDINTFCSKTALCFLTLPLFDAP